MKRPEVRIRVQLSVSVCLFTLVCLVSLALAIYTLSRNTLLRLERGNLDLNSRMLREECRQEFEDLYQSFYRLSYSNSVKHILNNYTDSNTINDAANLLHDSFGPDRILLMKLYLPNGTEILEVDSTALYNRSNVPNNLFPISGPSHSLNQTLITLSQGSGEFIGPAKAAKPIAGTKFLMSLTLPIKFTNHPYRSVNNTPTTKGYATFLVNCMKLERILSSISLSSAASEVGTAALCSTSNNQTVFDQLIPFNDHASAVVSNSETDGSQNSDSTDERSKLEHGKKGLSYNSSSSFPVPKKMTESLRYGLQPTAQINKGPNKSMISISQFSVLGSNYYVVILQSHDGVFSMTHHLRDIIILSSCVIGAGMIIFTVLFVSFGARQILRLKMAATYEQPAPTKWKFLPLPWWLRPANRKTSSDESDKSEFRVPEKVPLRKHVRDELDDITERFNTMSSQLRKQYALLEERVEARKAEIEQAREAADIANAAKSHFLARVTHELRTPLNGIIGTATLCLDEDDIDTIHQSLRTIFKCGELLLHLMTDLLSFSQNEVENLDLELRDFSLCEITSQLTAIFTEQCANKHINLTVDSAPEYNKYIFSGDTNRILQVIFNLMSNGIKFTPKGGGVHFKAVVEDDPENPHQKILTFNVTDNGPGIAPEMQTRVFEAFVQGDISSHVKKAGVGLGLSICRQLAERMNGTVLLHSELGKGSTFMFRIPLTFRLFDSESSTDSMRDSLDVSSATSMLRKPMSHNSTQQNSPLGTPLENPPHNNFDSALEAHNQHHQDSAIERDSPNEKSTDSSLASTARSVFSRTLSSTSFRTRGLLSTRRKTQDSIRRPIDLLKRRTSNDTVSARQVSQSSSNGTPPPDLTARIRKSSSKVNVAGSQPHLSVNTSMAGSQGQGKDGSSTEPSPSGAVGTSPASPPTQPEAAHREAGHQDSSFQKDAAGTASEQSSPESQKSSNGTKHNDGKQQPISLAGSKCSSGMEPKNTPLSAGLPVLPDAHFGAGGERSLTTPTGLGETKPSGDKPPPNIKVLVVDDNSVNQEVMVRMLNLEGLKRISVADDGLEAIEKIKEADAEGSSFDVVFMDVQMPNMDGRQATRVIRTELKSDVPIVAVSAFANDKNADYCLEAGMDLFLSKPLRRPHLREMLQSLPSITHARVTGGGEAPSSAPQSSP